MSVSKIYMMDTFSSRSEQLRRIQKYYSVHLEELIGLPEETGKWAISCYTQFVTNNTTAEIKRSKCIQATIAENNAFECLEKAYTSTKEAGLRLFDSFDKRRDDYGLLVDFPETKDKQMNAVHHILDEHERRLREGLLSDLPSLNIIRLRAAYNTALQSRVTFVIASEEAKYAREVFIDQWKTDSHYLATQFQWCLDSTNDNLFESMSKERAVAA